MGVPRVLRTVLELPFHVLVPWDRLLERPGHDPVPGLRRLARWRGRLGTLVLLSALVATGPAGIPDTETLMGRAVVATGVPFVAVLPPVVVLAAAAVCGPAPRTALRVLAVLLRSVGALGLLVVGGLLAAAVVSASERTPGGGPEALPWLAVGTVGLGLLFVVWRTAPVHFFGAADGHLWLPPLAATWQVWLVQALEPAFPGTFDRILDASGLPAAVRLLLGVVAPVTVTALGAAEVVLLHRWLGVTWSLGAGYRDGAGPVRQWPGG